MRANGLDILFLADRLRRDVWLPRRGRDALAHNVLKGVHAFVLNDVERVRKFAATDGRTRALRGLKHVEQLLRALDRFGRAFEFDPALAGRSLHAELALDRLQ